MLVDAENDKWDLGYRGQMAPVFDIHGLANRHLARADEKSPLLTGDFDGDGKLEAVMRTKQIGISQYRVYKDEGFRLKSLDLDADDHCPMVGDLDGDGRDEFVDYETLTITSYDIDGKRREYDGWPTDILPCACIDVNGDGRDEVVGVSCKLSWMREIDPKNAPLVVVAHGVAEAKKADQTRRELLKPVGGYFEVKTKKWTVFQFPDIDFRCDMFNGIPDEVLACDIDHDGQREIVTKPWVGCFIMAFGRDGKLKYYEEFGQGAEDFGTVHRKDQDYLAVQTESKLLIYP